MLMRLLKADLARGAFVAATLTALIALAATLMSAGTSLVVDSLSASNRLSQRAELPDLVQMHAGRIDDRDLQAIETWMEARSDVTDHEVIKTLPVARQELSINGVNQSESYNEPAFVTSPKHLDLLLDDDGEPVSPGPGEVVLPILTVLVLALGVIGFTWLTLRRIGRISAIEALRSGTSASLRPRRQRWRLAALRRLPVQVWLGAREALRPSNALMLGVLALCTFTMVLPTNISTTLSNPQVATYLGAGRADLRIDVRAGVQDLATVEQAVDSDPRVTRHATMLRRSYKMSSAAGGWETALIDIGNHEAFPVEYLSGHAPTSDDEVSLSYSQARDAGAKEGSTVTVQTADGNKDLTVTGVYQDITNDGHTAKATFDDGAPALWQIVYADAHSTKQASTLTKQLSGEYPGVQAISMNQYAAQFFGATGSQVRVITTLACAIALGLSFLITVLFTVLIVSRERPQIGVLMALGCTRRAVAGQYLVRFGLLALTGIALGLLGASALGSPAIGMVMASRGAPDLQLLPNWWLVGLVLPGALLATVVGAVALALKRLRTMPLTMTLTTGE